MKLVPGLLKISLGEKGPFLFPCVIPYTFIFTVCTPNVAAKLEFMLLVEKIMRFSLKVRQILNALIRTHLICVLRQS